MFLSTQDSFLGYFFALGDTLATQINKKARKINTYELISMIYDPGEIHVSCWLILVDFKH